MQCQTHSQFYLVFHKVVSWVHYYSFYIYVNDIPDAVNHSHCYLFADDAKLLKVIKSTSDHNELHQLSARGANSGTNYKKCSAVHFSTKSSQQSNVYTISECGIPFLESQRDLGVTVSGTLSWSQQCDTVCSKAYGALYVLRRNVHTTSAITIKKQLYLSLVKSSISYCCQLWRPHLCKNIQSIERIQRRATKYILKDYISDYKSRLLSLHMLPLMHWLHRENI